MSIQTIESYASQALSCSQQMLLLAEKCDWDGLGKLESQRAMLLDSLFEHPSLPIMLAKVADTLRRIIEVDQKTIAMGTEAKQALKNEMNLLSQGKRAVDAYLNNLS